MPTPIASNTNLKHAQLLGVPYAPFNLKETLEIFHKLLTGTKHNVFFINAHCVNVATSDAQYRRALQQASLVLPDGVGVQLAAKICNQPWQENLNGTDLFPAFCRVCQDTEQRVYLFGAKPGTAERVADWIKQHYPKLNIVGWHHGYCPPEHQQQLVQHINQCRTDVLFVAMGVPVQEQFLTNFRSQLNTRINIGVGGLFEFFSQNIPRAPLWLRRCKLEWCWRLFQEPKRLWRRYLVGSVLFMARIGFDAIKRRSLKRLIMRRFSFRQRWRSFAVKLLYRLRIAWRRFAKRGFDLLVSGLALLLCIPFLPLVALLIKLDSPGPLFFSQLRAGVNGRPFKMLKLRTMVTDAEQQLASLKHLNEKPDGVMFKMKNDPRVTRVGRILRRHSIDELPQFWNVLRGDMSVVGPRPALYQEVAQYQLTQRTRLKLQPGLTSDWVVAGRNALSFDEQAKLDEHYYFHQSLWYDIKLLCKTLPAVIFARGAS